MKYEIGDCVLIKAPSCHIPRNLWEFRKTFVGQQAIITKIFFDKNGDPTHYRIDIDPDELHRNVYIGPWWMEEWLEPYEDKMNFSLDESQLSSLL